MTTAAEQVQASFDEMPLQDGAIEISLEAWQQAQAGLEAAREDLRNAEKMMQALVSQKDLDEGMYRCGRFVVTISNVSAHQRVRAKLAKVNETARQTPLPERSHDVGPDGSVSNLNGYHGDDGSAALVEYELAAKLIAEAEADREFARLDASQNPPADEHEAIEQEQARSNLASRSRVKA